MKVGFSEYIKKLDASVLVAMAVFKGLKDKYLSKSLADISETASGGTPSRNNPAYYNGNIAWLKSGELNDGFISKAEETITELGLKNSTAKLVPKGTLLVAMYGATTGKVGILNIPATTNQAVCAILPKAELDRDYLFWFLRQHRYEFITISKGGAQPNISQTLINHTEIPLPPIQEQKNIAQLLTEIEVKKTVNENFIEKDFLDDVKKFLSIKVNSNQISTELNHQLALIKELRQAYLREAMQGKLAPQDSTDEPAETLLEKIKAEKEKLTAEKKIKRDKPLPPIKPEEVPFEIPSNWTWCRLGELCLKITDGTHNSPINNENGDYKYVTAKNIKNEGVDLSSITYISKKVHNEIYSRCNPEKGDVLLIKDGATTGVVTVNNLEEEFSLLSSVALLKLPKNMSKWFVVYAMRSPFYYEATRRDMFGVAITRVTLTKIQNSFIPLPPLAEQERIVAKLEKLLGFCDELEANIKEGISNADDLLQTALKEALEPEETRV
jgi:type I restriction enzyme S subunit